MTFSCNFFTKSDLDSPFLCIKEVSSGRGMRSNGVRGLNPYNLIWGLLGGSMNPPVVGKFYIRKILIPRLMVAFQKSP